VESLASGSKETLIRDYLRTYFRNMSALMEKAPVEFRESLLAPHRAHPAFLTVEDLESLNRQLPAALPPSFQTFLATVYIEHLEWWEFVISGYRSVEEARLRFQEGSVLWAAGYVQFAFGSGGDPVCFDVFEADENGEYPVIGFNHDRVPFDSWLQRELLQPYTSLVAPDFLTFLRKLCFLEDFRI
jgi:hypothetical protein